MPDFICSTVIVETLILSEVITQMRVATAVIRGSHCILALLLFSLISKIPVGVFNCHPCQTYLGCMPSLCTCTRQFIVTTEVYNSLLPVRGWQWQRLSHVGPILFFGSFYF